MFIIYRVNFETTDSTLRTEVSQCCIFAIFSKVKKVKNIYYFFLSMTIRMILISLACDHADDLDLQARHGSVRPVATVLTKQQVERLIY